MPDSPGEGGKFATDLYDLYEIAQNDLRPLASSYSGFSNQIEETNACDLNPKPVVGASFRGAAVFRSGSVLLALRDDIQYAFAYSSENVDAAAISLVDVAENYAAADEETQADFDASKAEGFRTGTTPPPPRPPVYPDSGGAVRRE